ncbi:PREDICTED: glutaredoxin-C9-like [Ipomoea nil]|uniref:glutaredoxin-C9-like n=1 Tax=Ipomoea nil TaxID=35883 RepID=UPI000901AEF1|nr:PREDICTED: glutaredoxin-C9-like [Ipomoea nil]
MQEAIPYKTWQLTSVPRSNPLLKPARSPPLTMSKTAASSVYSDGSVEDLRNMVAENAVIVFGRRGCCMIHVVKRLLQGLGANPAIYETDEGSEDDVVNELEAISAFDRKDGRLQFPTVFIGGRLFGGLDRVMGAHITGELTPILKDAGALWL